MQRPVNPDPHDSVGPEQLLEQAEERREAAVSFLLDIGGALHRSGAPAHRLEAILGDLAKRLGEVASFFSTPTAILASFGTGARTRTHLLRVEPAAIDLGKQAAIDETIVQLLADRLPVDEAHQRVRAIEAEAPPYGAWATTLAYGLTSGSVAVFLRGSWADVLISTGIGWLVGLLALLGTRHAGVGRLFEVIAALIATVVAKVATAAIVGRVPASAFVQMLAGVIVLIPGLTLTIAITELATRNLAAGTARLMSALVTFVQLAFGVVAGTAIGGGLLRAAGVATHPAQSGGLPLWAEAPALFVASVALTVLFRARWRDLPWILASAVLAVGSTKFASQLAGPQLGAFVGAFLVAGASNLRARLLDRPAAVTLVPGVLLLVPGSVGFRSVTAFLDRDVLGGIGTAFDMVLLATSLVAGLLVANAAVRPRHVL